VQIKRSRWGRFYIRLVTKNRVFFPLFVLLGLGGILFLSLHTHIDVIQTRSVVVEQTATGYALVPDAPLTGAPEAFEKIFVYQNKNQQVFVVEDVAVGPNGGLIFAADGELKAFLQGAPDGLSADIPVGRISLLARIFSRGRG